jgi:hypothetical protein
MVAEETDHSRDLALNRSEQSLQLEKVDSTNTSDSKTKESKATKK